MKTTETNLPGVLVVEPEIFEDERGFFFESYNEADFRKETGVSPQFVQDNHSRSARYVLRGLHYQIQNPQGKLVRVVSGEIFDVAVNVRRSSPHCGRWTGIHLSAKNRKQLWIPEGFAHGFVVLSDHADVLYKTTAQWSPEFERCIIWNDPDIAIQWPLQGNPVLSEKDSRGIRLRQAELFA